MKNRPTARSKSWKTASARSKRPSSLECGRRKASPTFSRNRNPPFQHKEDHPLIHPEPALFTGEGSASDVFSHVTLKSRFQASFKKPTRLGMTSGYNLRISF